MLFPASQSTHLHKCISVLLWVVCMMLQARATTFVVKDDISLKGAIDRAMQYVVYSSKRKVTIVSVCFPSDVYWRALCPLSKGNFDRYASVHGYGIQWFSHNLAAPRHPAWSKVPAILAVLRQNTVSYVVWVDSDSVFMNIRQKLTNALPPSGYHLAYAGGGEVLAAGCIWSSQMVFRTGSWAQEFLQAVWHVYPEPEPMGFFEQASMQYLLSGARQDQHCRWCVARQGTEYNPNNLSRLGTSQICSDSRGLRHPEDSCCKPHGKWGAHSWPIPTRIFGSTLRDYRDGDLLITFPGMRPKMRAALIRHYTLASFLNLSMR